MADDPRSPPGGGPAWPVFLVFLRLGVSSFGGPIAHLGYFRHEFVSRRRWLSDRSYADIVALCQFLPGPASSQVGIALGLLRAGVSGAFAAWLGFTLPSALVLTLFGLGISAWSDWGGTGALQGLRIAAVAVVAQAAWGMARSFCTDTPRCLIAAVSAGAVLQWPGAAGQMSVIFVAAGAGLLLFRPADAIDHETLPVAVGRRTAVLCLGLWVALLIGLPAAAAAWPNQTLTVFNAFFRVGSLVFGGGHVVLPLLEAAVVPAGWVASDTFVAGYGAAQAVPGPLFTFASFLGAASVAPPHGWTGSLICLVAVFAPSFLLVFGALPFWAKWRNGRRFRAALMAVNAAVVGLLLAALCQPALRSAVSGLQDVVLGVLALLALIFFRLPAWLVVAACSVSGLLWRLRS